MINEKDRQRYAISQNFNELEFKLSKDRYLKGIIKNRLELNDKYIVDLGSGYGRGVMYLLEWCDPVRIIAIEGNKDSHEMAKKEFPNERIKYIHGYVHEFELANESVDYFSFVEVIEHLDEEEVDITLKKIHAALVNEGHLYIATPSIRKAKEDYPQGSHYTEYYSDELIELVESYGFKKIWFNEDRNERKGDESMMMLFRKI